MCAKTRLRPCYYKPLYDFIDGCLNLQLLSGLPASLATAVIIGAKGSVTFGIWLHSRIVSGSVYPILGCLAARDVGCGAMAAASSSICLLFGFAFIPCVLVSIGCVTGSIDWFSVSGDCSKFK